jgi:cell division septum initiation protein DivIVA
LILLYLKIALEEKMKDNVNLEELSREDLVTIVKRLQLKATNLEEERQVVGESLIKAQKLGEVIQEKAQKQAEDIIAAAEAERENMLGNLHIKKAELKKDIERLLQLQSKVVLELERTVEKYQVIVNKEKEEISTVEAENRRLLESAEEEEEVLSGPSIVNVSETVDLPDSTIVEEPLEPETVLTDVLPTSVPSIESTSSHDLDLTETLVEPEPTPNTNEINLEDLISSPSSPPAVEEPSEDADIQEFMSGLKQETVSKDSGFSSTPEVSLEDLLADGSEETPKATVSPGLEDLLASPDTSSTPNDETDLSKILSPASESSSSFDGQLVDVGDLLK